MDSIICDRCGKSLLSENVRYLLKIHVVSAYDVMEITDADLKKDFRKEIDDLVKSTEGKSEQELCDGVYKEFHFDLCANCQQEYIRNPLPRKNPPHS